MRLVEVTHGIPAEKLLSIICTFHLQMKVHDDKLIIIQIFFYFLILVSIFTAEVHISGRLKISFNLKQKTLWQKKRRRLQRRQLKKQLRNQLKKQLRRQQRKLRRKAQRKQPRKESSHENTRVQLQSRVILKNLSTMCSGFFLPGPLRVLQ